jgi:hypothetical protein
MYVCPGALARAAAAHRPPTHGNRRALRGACDQQCKMCARMLGCSDGNGQLKTCACACSAVRCGAVVFAGRGCWHTPAATSRPTPCLLRTPNVLPQRASMRARALARRPSLARSPSCAAALPRHCDRHCAMRSIVERRRAGGGGGKGTPTKGTPTKSTPTKGTPTKGTPTKGTPTKGTPTKGTPTKGTPTKGTPTKGTPTKGTPTQGTHGAGPAVRRGWRIARARAEGAAGCVAADPSGGARCDARRLLPGKRWSGC